LLNISRPNVKRFFDENNRTAFISVAVFLERNRLHARAPELEVVQDMNALAAGQMSEWNFGAWFKRAFPQ
jgi:death-on-curing protein